MIINLRVIPGAKKNLIPRRNPRALARGMNANCFLLGRKPRTLGRGASLKEETGRLKVWISAPASDGRANKELIELLSERFGLRKSRIRIIRGERSREKVVEISP